MNIQYDDDDKHDEDNKLYNNINVVNTEHMNTNKVRLKRNNCIMKSFFLDVSISIKYLSFREE